MSFISTPDWIWQVKVLHFSKRVTLNVNWTHTYKKNLLNVFYPEFNSRLHCERWGDVYTGCWTSYPASASRSWLCLRAVRVKSGRMATRLFSRPQWAVMRSGVTTTTGFSAGSSLWWESGEEAESFVSVSLWPGRHINGWLIEMPCGWFTHCVKSNLSGAADAVVTYPKQVKVKF